MSFSNGDISFGGRYAHHKPTFYKHFLRFRP
nr:MAG TPA: hypothetical protein [Caudoviricetes sp.]